MIEHDSFTVNLTSKITLPDVDYINDLAIDKGFTLGKSFATPPKILNDLYFLFQKENLDPLTFNKNKYLLPSEYIEEEVLFRPLNSGEAAYYKYTLLFLQGINFSSVLGVTPLDKTLNVLMYLTYLSDKTNPQGRDEGAFSDKNITIQDEQALADALKEQAEGLDTGMEGAKGDVTDGEGGINTEGSNNQGESNELSNSITKCVRDHLYDLTPSIANIYGKKKPADVPINKNILNEIKIKSYLENTVGLSTALDTRKVKNNDSNESKSFQMDEYNKITKIKKSSMMLENFDDKFIKKELNVKEKVKPETKKQILYMLLDDSGSMGNIHKQTYVRSVLLNRLESVNDGKSILKFCLYESQRYHFREATDLKSVQVLYKDIALRRPNGGGTYIGNVLQETINEIANLEEHHDPEIMIVCDGDDYVDPKNIDYKGVRINVVLLGTENYGLKKIAEETDGFYTCEQMYNR